MDKKAGTGELSCKVCGQQFQTGINCMFWTLRVLTKRCSTTDVSADLSAAVDVYSDWLDACDTVAKDTTSRDNSAPKHPLADGRIRSNSDIETDINARFGIVDDEEDGEGEYDDD